MSHALAAPILLVEDDANDVFFVRQALKAALIRNPVEVFDSAERACDYLSRHAAGIGPVLIILDMNLAGPHTGLDVLTWIRQRSAPLGSTPVLMLTGSDRQEERDASERLGAMNFLQKPVTTESLTAAVRTLGFSVVNNISAGQLGIHIVDSHSRVCQPAVAAPASVPTAALADPPPPR